MRRLQMSRLLLAAVIVAAAAESVSAQTNPPAKGIPIDHKLTIEKCGGCHQRDKDGTMSRISFIRTIPEIWEQAIKRMIRLNGIAVTPVEVREIVKYLSSNNGLAPEEQEPASWEVDHSLPGHQFDYAPEALGKTCNYCHTIGRVLLQRRTREDYEKLAAFHVAMFPGAENQFHPQRSRRRNSPSQAIIRDSTGNGVVLNAPRQEDLKAPYPIDTILDYLTKNQPLITPEWTAWKATMANPKLAGTWAVSGYQAGRGKAFGTLTIQATSAPDEFTTKLQLYYPAKDTTLTRTGKGIIYTGYSWRGREKADTPPAPSADPGSNPAEWREAMMVSRDGNSMRGRWFWGGYDEFGIDVTLTRLQSQPVVLGTDLYSLQSPGAKREL